MVPPTRRAFLHGAAGLTACLAGCNAIETLGGSAHRSKSSADDGGSGPTADSTTDPESVRVRVTDTRPPIWLAGPDGNAGRPTPGDHSRHFSSVVVDSRARADRVEMVDVSGVERARSFLADTAFDSETVYIQTHRVRECFRLDLCHISWQPTLVETDYARRLLPYDEQCAADTWAIEVWLIRIPDVLSADEVSGSSVSVGSAGCDRSARRGEATGGHGSADAVGTVAVSPNTPNSANAQPDGGR